MLIYFKKFTTQYIVFSLLFLFGICVFAKPHSPVDLLSQLLRNFKTYQADFKQVTYNGKGAVMQRSHGRMVIKRPGGFRWKSDSPTKQILITDGKILWVYNVDLAQATKSKVDQKANLNPASLLSGSIKDLTQQFNISHVAKGDDQVFLLRPKRKGVNFKMLELTFHKGVLTKMKVLNNLDENSIFKFDHIQINQPVSSKLFQFKPPPGVDIVTQ